MPNSAVQKIFISYARTDGAELAQRLQKQLSSEGHDVWLDKQRIRGGSSWTKEIEIAIDKADFVLAVLSPGSYVSEICRAEQLRSLRKNKCVIPLKAKRDTDVPLHLEQKNYLDFTTDSTYTEAFTKLLKDIEEHNGVTLRETFRETYVTAPPLPINYVARPRALSDLRDALIADGNKRHITLTALVGMGGIGKTVLAKALCHDEVVQEAFPDGVIWITVGKESAFDLVTHFREVGKALGDDLTRYDNELGCRNQYRSTIRSKAALIVVDDVWEASDLEPFLAESVRSQLLFTTRNANIAAAVGAREHVAYLLTVEQSREVLAQWAGVENASLPPLADSLIRECDRLPLALSMVGAMLRGKPAALWSRVRDLLHNADLGKIGAQFPDYPYPSLLVAIKVSIGDLKKIVAERYLALAVLLEDMPASPVVQQCLWKVDVYEAAETAGQLVSLSLAQLDGADGGIRLHDLQLDYIRAQYPDRTALSLILEAIRLSSSVIASDSLQFASQVVGRLLAHISEPPIKRFVDHLCESAPRPWLRPLWPSLRNSLGTSLHTLSAHSGPIIGVAVDADGQIAVSASWDMTLKVWEIASGRELRTLRGHSDRVTGVAVSADGRVAVSASWDMTLKVWETASGRELRTLRGHSGRVTGVAVSADGRVAVSASWDMTLKVWDIASGRELRTLAGHHKSVNGVAVSADGRVAVSASWDRTLKVWDLSNGNEQRTLAGHAGGVLGVAVSADGRLTVSAAEESMLIVWDVEKGYELRILRGHSAYVTGIGLSPDRRLAVSASYDKTIKVWDLASGEAPVSFTCDGGAVSCTFINDRRIIVGDQLGSIHLLQLETTRNSRSPVDPTKLGD